MPYHLATPQRKPNCAERRDTAHHFREFIAASRKCRERMPCERAREASRESSRRSAQRLVRLALRRERRANTHAPEPVIRAAATRAAAPRSPPPLQGNRGRRHGREVVAPVTLGKDVYFRRRRRACQFGRREDRRRCGTCAGGTRARATTAAATPASGRSPMPRAMRVFAADEKRNVGAQRRRRCAASSARGKSSSHSRLSASSTLAASELPPPSPPPIGMRLSSAIVTPRATPVAACSACAARTREIVFSRHARHGSARTIAPSSRASSVIVSAQIDQREQRFERVIAVGAPPGDVQEEVDLRRRGNHQRRHRVGAPASLIASDRRRCAPRSARRRDSASTRRDGARPCASSAYAYTISQPSCRSTQRRPGASRSSVVRDAGGGAPRIHAREALDRAAERRACARSAHPNRRASRSRPPGLSTRTPVGSPESRAIVWPSGVESTMRSRVARRAPR